MDQIISIFMFALGMKNPSDIQGAVQGEQTVAEQQLGQPTSTPKTEAEFQAAREEAKRMKAEKAAELKTAREAKKAEMTKLREEQKDKYKKMLELQKQKSEKYREEIAAKKEEAQEAFKDKREAFEDKLETIRDERKQEIVENLDEKINTLNDRRTTQMIDHLGKMSEILIKVEERADASGKDTATVDAAISAAQGAIAAAKAKASEQAAKEYVITIGTDETLKTDVGVVMNTLQTDLKSAQALIVEARHKVSAAIKALGMLLGTGREATPSGSL
jgi:DNA repair exonuclease SbcCD ATPase subunit